MKDLSRVFLPLLRVCDTLQGSHKRLNIKLYYLPQTPYNFTISGHYQLRSTFILLLLLKSKFKGKYPSW